MGARQWHMPAVTEPGVPLVIPRVPTVAVALVAVVVTACDGPRGWPPQEIEAQTAKHAIRLCDPLILPSGLVAACAMLRKHTLTCTNVPCDRALA
jgi:predicted small secreted protein